jgi:hypothetical protein
VFTGAVSLVAVSNCAACTTQEWLSQVVLSFSSFSRSHSQILTNQTSTMTDATAFLRAWTKLADELKLAIISHALPADQKLIHAQFNTSNRDDIVSTMTNMGGEIEIPKEWYLFDTEVLPLLACPPIAPLVREAFYAQNTFVLGGNSAWRMFRRADSFTGPLASKVRPWVRRTVLQLSPHAETIGRFAKLPSWFPKLHVCHIDLTCWYHLKREDMAPFRDFVTHMAPIEIPTIKLVLEHKAYPDDCEPFEPVTTPHAELEELLMSKITIAVPGGKGLIESWERFTFEPKKYCITPGKTLQHFEAWPVIAEEDGHGRTTRKTVQVGSVVKL